MIGPIADPWAPGPMASAPTPFETRTISLTLPALWQGHLTYSSGGNRELSSGSVAPTTAPAGLPADFADWLRRCHAETSGSAREAYARVAERLSIRL
jgi:hypothetical protein